jgi:presenilin-like A22 family membrane protease
VKNWFLGGAVLVLVVGGILLEDHGPAYGIPSFIGEIVAFTSVLTVGLFERLSKKEWVLLGILYILFVAEALLFAFGQQNEIFSYARYVCLLVVISVGLWLIALLSRKRRTSKG